ncbi:MAG: hypothetical protein JSS83_20945 [Cyanobacteria bacterium SZAS LIN-3]|nr:hypothetical protein [Cyanobacteria bacterium SZAS LIN-3]MBS2011095.1 hypothetical protein [Cyanobacteria bacterium SZAS TMP-1]
MYKYDLTLPGRLRVRVETSLPVFDSASARLLLHAYVPGVSFFSMPEAEGKVDLTVRYVVASGFEPDFSPALTVTRDLVVLTDIFAGDGSLLDLIHLIYSAVRPLWIKRGLYPVHSACVAGRDGGYKLIVGHSGAGKTAIALAQAAAGGKIFSGNKTLVAITANGGMYAVAGTRTMTRAGADGKPSTATGVVSYQERVAFELGDLSVISSGSESQMAVPITLIALARLNDGANQCTRLSSLSALHKLYPFFVDTVNADTVLCAGETLFSGALSAACVKKVSAALARGTKSVPVISVAGSMSAVLKAMEEKYG